MSNKMRTAHRRADRVLAGALALALAGGASANEIVRYARDARARAAIPESIFVTPSPVALERALRASEARCLAEAMYFEARGEGSAGERAVAEVVLQRTRDHDYDKTVCAVVYAGAHPASRKCQFSFACNGSLRQAREPKTWSRLQVLASDILSGAARLSGATGEAIAYHSQNVMPAWAKSMERTVQIGNHFFYRRASTTQEVRADIGPPELSQFD